MDSYQHADKKVGVIIATCDRYDMCLEAVKSALNQTHRNVEVIVIDDCSTDARYLTMTKSVNDPRLKYIRLSTSSKDVVGNSSPGYVRNQGILSFQGDFIAILDDDDAWFPHKLNT